MVGAGVGNNADPGERPLLGVCVFRGHHPPGLCSDGEVAIIIIAQGSPGRAEFRRHGILLPVQVRANGHARTVLAEWDTGSRISSVSRAVMQQLGAPQSGSVAIYTVQGDSTVPEYQAGLVVTLPTGGQYNLSRGATPVLGDSLTGRAHVLIGREIQQHYHLEVDGPSGSWAISGPVAAGPFVATVRTEPLPWWPVGAVGGLAALAVAILEAGGRGR